jgi:glycosyltransferase involved in cell wall biosynthesis
MTPLRVGFDTGPLYGPKTGIGRAVQALHDALAARDDVALVDYLVSARARPPVGTHKLPFPAALAHRCWAHGQHPRADRWLGDAQLVHGTNYVVPPSRLPRVVSVYDCWFLRQPAQAQPAVHRAGQVLRRAVASGAVVHTSSFATQQAVRELFPHATVRTVHLGPLALPAPPATAPIALHAAPFILALGTIERRKNLPRLVQAFGAVAARHADVQLVLAGGGGDDEAAVHRAVDALGPQLAPRVAFTGRVDEPTRSWLLHHAAVLAYPSLDEGFGFPLLDAMQAGVPVVASTAGSIPEVAGEAALLSAPDDVDALASNLELALTSQSVRDHLVATGGRRWQQFSWQRCADEMMALYHDTVAGRVGEPEGR